MATKQSLVKRGLTSSWTLKVARYRTGPKPSTTAQKAIISHTCGVQAAADPRIFPARNPESRPLTLQDPGMAWRGFGSWRSAQRPWKFGRSFKVWLLKRWLLAGLQFQELGTRLRFGLQGLFLFLDLCRSPPATAKRANPSIPDVSVQRPHAPRCLAGPKVSAQR